MNTVTEALDDAVFGIVTTKLKAVQDLAKDPLVWLRRLDERKLRKLDNALFQLHWKVRYVLWKKHMIDQSAGVIVPSSAFYIKSGNKVLDGRVRSALSVLSWNGGTPGGIAMAAIANFNPHQFVKRKGIGPDTVRRLRALFGV